MRDAVINTETAAIVTTANGDVRLLPISSIGDYDVKKLFELVKRLPDNFGLFFDSNSMGMRVFQINTATFPDLGDGFVINGVRAQRSD